MLGEKAGLRTTISHKKRKTRDSQIGRGEDWEAQPSRKRRKSEWAICEVLFPYWEVESEERRQLERGSWGRGNRFKKKKKDGRKVERTLR